MTDRTNDSASAPVVPWQDPRVLLRRAGLHADASLGQNFLVNPGVVDKIVAVLRPIRGHLVFEVGPGLGHLTQALAMEADQVVALDADPRMVRLCRERLSPLENRVRVIQGDATAVNLREALGELDRPLLAAGNLPFYCSTEILFRLLDDLDPRRVVIMVQKEVARRMAATPGGKEYGSLSVACQVRSDVSVAFDISPGSFFPQPEVSASVVVMVPRQKLSSVRLAALERVTKVLFGMRRKTLRTSLRKAGWYDALKGAVGPVSGLADSGLRAERLSPGDFLAMTDALLDRLGPTAMTRQRGREGPTQGRGHR